MDPMIPNSGEERNPDGLPGGGPAAGGIPTGSIPAGGFAAWRGRGPIIELAATVIPLAIILTIFSRFILFVESRPGVRIPDPILAGIPPRDLTVPIFVLIYGGIVLAIISLARHPRELVVTLRAYALLLVVRMAAMYVIPLEPPAGMITLIDPIYSVGPGTILTKDLFFSGHTATMFLLTLTARGARMRNIFLLATVAMAVLLLAQHCHYSIDVLAAPFFAYTCYRLSLMASGAPAMARRWIRRRSPSPEPTSGSAPTSAPASSPESAPEAVS